MLATVGNLKPSNLQSLSLLFSLLTSSESSDDDLFVSAAVNDPFIVEVGRRCQQSRPNEGATLDGPRQSRRLR